MLALLRRLFSRYRPHRHDFTMCFENPDSPFDITYRCKCGAMTYDTQEALWTSRSIDGWRDDLR